MEALLALHPFLPSGEPQPQVLYPHPFLFSQEADAHCWAAMVETRVSHQSLGGWRVFLPLFTLIP